jgi:zinc protease
MAVVAVGDIDPVWAEKLIQAHFGHLKNPSPARPREYAPIPTRSETEALVVTDKEVAGGAVLIRYPVQPVIDAGTIGAYREELVERLFGAMLNQRLQALTQLPQPPFIGASSSLGKLTRRYKAYSAGGALGSGGAQPAIAALVQENERARRFGFTAAELERVRKNMMRTFERAHNERDKSDSAVYAAEYLRNFLEDEAIPGIETEYRYVTELLPAITLEEMNAYARRTIPADSGKLVLYTGSSNPSVPLPTGAELLAAVAAAEKAELTAHDEKAVAAQLMDTPPPAGSIVAESFDKTLGLTRLTLSNGVKVILKPTDFRNDQVVMSALRFGGQSLFDDKDILNARYANSIVAAMGLKDLSPIDVRKVLAGKAANVSMGLSTHSEVVTGTAGANEIETMLQLVWLRFAGVRRDEDLYKSFIGKQVEQARNRLAQPGARLSDTLVATLYNNHPRAPRALRPEEFAQISLDRSIDIYRQRFSSARELTFVFVGSFDVAAVKPLLATYLASLPTPDIPVAFRDDGLRPVAGVVKREVPGGADDKSTVSLTFTGPAEFSEREQMRMAALMEVMNIRIIDVLREKMALIYGGGMSGGIARVPYQNYTIAATLPTGQANVDKVLAATFAEIERMKTQGPDQEDLDKVKSNWRQKHRKSLRENGYWLAHLQTALTNGTDPATILQFEQQLDSLGATDLKVAAQRYFNTDNYVQVLLNPDKKQATAAPAAVPAG